MADPGTVWPRLERRAWLHERVADPVADGRRRSAALGVSTLTIVRVRNRSFDGYKMFLSPRSCTVATQRRRYHVVPSGMFQPFIPGESADLLEGQFSVLATAVREFVEELYGVEELETGDGRVDPQAIYRRRESQLLNDMLKHGTAALLYTGVGVNLLALRHEVCTVLVIDDPGWSERECGELRICGEYLRLPSWAPSQLDQNGYPTGVSGNGELAEATKRRQVEAYLAALGPGQLSRLTTLGPRAAARELTGTLNGQGIQVSERYVQQILDDWTAQQVPDGARKRGSRGRW